MRMKMIKMMLMMRMMQNVMMKKLTNNEELMKDSDQNLYMKDLHLVHLVSVDSIVFLVNAHV